MDDFRSTSSSSFSSRSSSVFDPFAGSSTSTNLHGFADIKRHPERLTAADDGVRCVVVPKEVIICYGPYMAQGILDYRTERIEGLQHQFYKLGVHTFLKKAHHINLLKIWYMDSVIFSCKMTDLHHGGEGSLDAKCKQAVQVFKTVFHKAAHELRLRHEYGHDGHVQKVKEEDVCNLCVCAQRKATDGKPQVYDNCKTADNRKAGANDLSNDNYSKSVSSIDSAKFSKSDSSTASTGLL